LDAVSPIISSLVSDLGSERVKALLPAMRTLRLLLEQNND